MAVIRDVRKVLAAAAFAVIGATSVGYADAPSGTAVDVVPLARADGAAGFRVLIDQGSVYSGDKIVTGPVGQAQILFRDNTKLVVGPNSSMTIDAFVTRSSILEGGAERANYAMFRSEHCDVIKVPRPDPAGERTFGRHHTCSHFTNQLTSLAPGKGTRTQCEAAWRSCPHLPRRVSRAFPASATAAC